MTNSYDTIIIGGGHNGLVAAALLVKAGQKVLVLERRNVLGGAAATEKIWPGFRVNTGANDAGLFRPEVAEALDLEKHGLQFVESTVAAVSLQPDGRHLTLWHNVEKSVVEIARFSKRDAEKFPAFIKQVTTLTKVLNQIIVLTPPEITQTSFAEMLPWLKTALQLKRLGKRDMMEFMRVLPMTTGEFLDEWFESDALKGMLGAAGITGSMQGPYASGTAFMMLYHYLGSPIGGFRSSKFVRGGIGELSAALCKSAQSQGAEFRTETEVEKVILEDGDAVGVVLSNGDEIRTKRVISNLDPYRTFIELVGAPNLGPQFVRKVRNVRFRGSTAKLNLGLNELPRMKGLENKPECLDGHLLISPSLEYLERAYDDAKYGKYSQSPILDIVIPTVLDSSLAPEGKHIMSISMQYAPYNLKSQNWDVRREELSDRIVEALCDFSPNLKRTIQHKQMITPLDWEKEYGLTEGSIFHGQMGLDQLLFMRPVPGNGRYRTPIKNLYLCGAGTHPGGGVTGAPGFNAARELLKDRKKEE
jgi:phytoene dehydrogenase-like protein